MRGSETEVDKVPPSSLSRICSTPTPRWGDPLLGHARRSATAGCAWHRPARTLVDCPPPPQWAPPSHAPGGCWKKQKGGGEMMGRSSNYDFLFCGNQPKDRQHRFLDIRTFYQANQDQHVEKKWINNILLEFLLVFPPDRIRSHVILAALVKKKM